MPVLFKASFKICFRMKNEDIIFVIRVISYLVIIHPLIFLINPKNEFQWCNHHPWRATVSQRTNCQRSFFFQIWRSSFNLCGVWCWHMCIVFWKKKNIDNCPAMGKKSLIIVPRRRWRVLPPSQFICRWSDSATSRNNCRWLYVRYI
jgi:hypothetical protein